MVPSTGQQGRNCWRSVVRCTAAAPAKQNHQGLPVGKRRISFTVGQAIYSGTAEDATQLADCYRNSLNLAKEHDVHSIAFPAISTGVYGYPLEDATEIAVKTVAQWLGAHADYAMQVIFVIDARTCGCIRQELCNSESGRMVVELYLGKQDGYGSRILLKME